MAPRFFVLPVGLEVVARAVATGKGGLEAVPTGRGSGGRDSFAA